MHAGAGDLADGVEAGERGAADEVGGHAAHQVVRRRRHRDRLARPVEAALADGAVDRGEAAREELAALLVGRAQPGRIEEDGPAVLRLHLARDRAGDDVARRELAVGVRVEREAPAVLVDERRTLAADGLGDEERLADAEDRRVELEELEVAHLGAGAQRRGDAVAGRDRGIRRVRVQLAGAAGGEHDGVGLDDLAASGDGGRGRRCGVVADEQLDARGRARPRRTRSTRNACSITRTSLARSCATSAFSIAVPVASPPECRMRG